MDAKVGLIVGGVVLPPACESQPAEQGVTAGW
jgi:hypothetical protein